MLDRLIKGEISKEEYIENTAIASLDELGINPEKLVNCDAVEQKNLCKLLSIPKVSNSTDEQNAVRLFDDLYQSYSKTNSIAKYLLARADVFEFRDKARYLAIRKFAFSLYNLKDEITKQMINIKKDFRAYPIYLKSKKLSGQIIEILFENDFPILHTKSDEIRTFLVENEKLESIKESAISDYVNTKLF